MRQLFVRLQAAVLRTGYAYLPHFPARSEDDIVALASRFGRLWSRRDAASPFVRTSPSRHASVFAPFDRAEQIGWHNDFSSLVQRPRLSLAYVEREDPDGPLRGAWRAASCDRVLAELAGSAKGRRVIDLLRKTELPYSFSGRRGVALFRAVRIAQGVRVRFRFFGTSMREGARRMHGRVPDELEDAIQTVERAADRVGRTLPAGTGALLVTDNWHSLHDRLPQSIDGSRPLRRALLCFVSDRRVRVRGEGALQQSERPGVALAPAGIRRAVSR